MRRWTRAVSAAAFVLSLAFAAGAGASESDDAQLAAVLEPFEQVQALSAHFREEKRIALLKEPLVSEGELHYARPHRLARHTKEPIPSRLLVDDRRLTMVDEAGVQHLDLESQPEVAALVDALMLLFEGDAKRLQDLMRYELEVEDGHFHLKLTPRDEKLKKLIREMEAEGKGARLSQLRIVDGTGDVTVTTFSDIELRQPFSEAERARLFSVKP